MENQSLLEKNNLPELERIVNFLRKNPGKLEKSKKVLEYALKLQETEGGDRNAIILSSLLYNTIDTGLLENPYFEASEFAKNFTKNENVIKTIKNFKKPLSLEGMILHDAASLLEIGVTGLLQELKKEDSVKRAVNNYTRKCLEKDFYTEKGRKLASKELKKGEGFLSFLKKEF